jgi:hypothetical protein
MESGSRIVYNESREVLLSGHVAEVSENLKPLQILALLMNGRAIDPQACVWLRKISTPEELPPRLFAFDVAYLDAEHRIIETGSVGPGTEYPPVPDEAASVLFLRDRRLAETGSGRGDLVAIAAKADTVSQVESALQSSPVPRKVDPEAEHSKNRPEELFQREETSKPEFVFEPFGGTLLNLPDAGTPAAQSAEFFLTAQEPEKLLLVPIEEPAKEETSEDAAEEPGETQSSHTKQMRTRSAASNRGAEQKTPEPNAPRFFTPVKIRFYDPAATEAKEEAGEEPGANEVGGMRRSTELPPALKAAILMIDERLRREREAEEEGRGKKEKLRAGKKRPAKSRDKDTGHDAVEPTAGTREGTTEQAELQPALEPAVKREQEELHRESSKSDTAVDEDEVAPETKPDLTASTEPLAVPAVEAADAEEARSAPASGPVMEQVPPPNPFPDPMARTSEELQLPSAVGSPTEASPEPSAPVSSAPDGEKPPQTVGSKKIHRKKPETPRKLEPEEAGEDRPEAKQEKNPLGTRLQKWLAGQAALGRNMRRSERISIPGLVAFYWSGGAPRPHQVVNISRTGFYLRTSELWSPDTIVRMTLQRPQHKAGAEKQSLSVLTRVVRIDEGGAGHEFVTTEFIRGLKSRDILPEQGTSRKDLEKFLARR